MLNKNVALIRDEIVADPAKYAFECHSIMISPLIQVYDKDRKLVLETSISAMIQDGTCTADYAESLFKSIKDSLPGTLLQAIENRKPKDNNG